MKTWVTIATFFGLVALMIRFVIAGDTETYEDYYTYLYVPDPLDLRSCLGEVQHLGVYEKVGSLRELCKKFGKCLPQVMDNGGGNWVVNVSAPMPTKNDVCNTQKHIKIEISGSIHAEECEYFNEKICSGWNDSSIARKHNLGLVLSFAKCFVREAKEFPFRDIWEQLLRALLEKLLQRISSLLSILEEIFSGKLLTFKYVKPPRA
ncbi:uncharacterized protein LOC144139130 [Haemaphysalis longicornis]